MKKFETPEIEIQVFELVDVIATSVLDPEEPVVTPDDGEWA